MNIPTNFNKNLVRFADDEQDKLECQKQQSTQLRQQQCSQQKQQEQIKFKQKMIMNDLLFSYDDEKLSEENQINESPSLQNPNQMKNQTSKKKFMRSSSGHIRSNSGHIRSANVSPRNEDKQQPQRRGSQQTILLTFPKIQFDKNFELEVKNDGDSIPYSESDTSSSSEICQSFQEEDGLENSQIQTLKRKQSRRIFNSSESNSSNESKNKETLNKKQDQTISLLHTLLKKITEKDIKNLQKWKLYEGLTDVKASIWDEIQILTNTDFNEKDKLKEIINNLFIENLQCILESSVMYQYFEEFRELQNSLELTKGQKSVLTLKKEIIEKILNLENEKYVKILYLYSNQYLLENELSNDFLKIFQSNFSQQKYANKLALTAQIMVFYYSVEFLAPKMIREVFQKIITKKQEIEKEIINLCLESSNYDFLFSYYESTKIKIAGWVEDADTQKCLVRALGRSTGMNFQAVLFFIRKIKLWSQKNLIHLMAETLSERLDASNNDTNFLFTFSNPLKVIVLIIEILQIIMKHEIFHKNICQRTLQKYSHFAKTFIRTGIDEEQMYSMLVDWDLEGRKLLYIIYENSIQDLIAEDRVQDVIDILWHGNSNSTINMLNFFSISQNLFYTKANKFVKDPEKLHFSLSKQYEKDDFLGRLSIWIKQIQFRYFFDQLQIFAFMICLLAYFLSSFSIFTDGFFPIRDESEIVQQTISRLQHNLSYWIIVPLFIAVNLPLNAISNLIYLKEFEKNTSLTLQQGFDILFGLIMIAYIAFIYSMKQMEFNDSQVTMVVLLNVLTALCFLRMILCLTVTKAFGPLFQALQVIFFEVAKFLNAFIAFLMLFTFIGYIVFNQMETGQFNSFLDGLLFLVEAMFGQFSFADFSNLYPAVGYIFMIVYLYTFAIVFMNVLVAILTFNFEITNRQSRMLHYQHTIFHVRQGNYIQKHGCLIVVPIVLEFLILPYLILKYIINCNSPFMKGLRECYIVLSYIPILIFSVLICLVINLVLLPFAYFQHLFLLSREVYHKSVKVSILFKWIFLGIFLMLKQLFYDDMKKFCFYLCSKQSQQEREKQQQKKITFDSTMKSIFQTICNMYVSGITYCTISELFNQVKEDIQNPSKYQGKESCVDDKVLVGVHLLKRRNIPAVNSPNIEHAIKKKQSSTPLQLHILQRKNSSSNIQIIDKINVKHTFQGIKQMEDISEFLYEYFLRFCFKDIARNEEQRDQAINLHNLLKLHEHYSIPQLRVVTHSQLYKTVKLT